MRDAAVWGGGSRGEKYHRPFLIEHGYFIFTGREGGREFPTQKDSMRTQGEGENIL